MINTKNQGGLEMPHLQSIVHANKISWVHRLLSKRNPKSKWKMLLKKQL